MNRRYFLNRSAAAAGCLALSRQSAGVRNKQGLLGTEDFFAPEHKSIAN
jgi:hypothetical protein